MKQITKHFSLIEFIKSRTAAANNIDNTLQYLPSDHREFIRENIYHCARMLEAIRTLVDNKPISIRSGYRSPALNKLVGGSATSQHVYAAAVDIECMGVSNEDLFRTIINANDLEWDQCILEFYDRSDDDPNSGWVHLGCLRYDEIKDYGDPESYQLPLRRHYLTLPNKGDLAYILK